MFYVFGPGSIRNRLSTLLVTPLCSASSANSASSKANIVEQPPTIKEGFYCRQKNQSWSGSGETVCIKRLTTMSTWPECSWGNNN